MVRFRVDLSKIVRVGKNEAHWHVPCRLKDLTNPEVALTDLDILEPAEGSVEAVLWWCIQQGASIGVITTKVFWGLKLRLCLHDTNASFQMLPLLIV